MVERQQARGVPHRAGERGVALAASLLILLILMVLGIGVLAATHGTTTASRGLRSQAIALQTAEAGIEYAREVTRVRRKNMETLSEILETARNGDSLVDARSRANFLDTDGFTNDTTNLPVVSTTALGNAAFQVFLTNDRIDGVTSTTDTNEEVLATAFGTGGNELGFASIQVKLKVPLPDLPTLPGVITLPGPDVTFDGLESNSHVVEGQNADATGGCYPTVAVTSSTAHNRVSDDILGPPDRSSRYRTCDSAPGPSPTGVETVDNFIRNVPGDPSNPYEPSTVNDPTYVDGDPRLAEVAYLEALVEELREEAHHTSTDEPDFSYGTPDDPKVVVLDGDVSIGQNTSGAGILVVTGRLHFEGNINYDGLILAVGDGELTIAGGGAGELNGALLVANTNDPWEEDPNYVGVPTYRDNGAGTANQTYDSDSGSGELARRALPLHRIAYQHLR